MHLNNVFALHCVQILVQDVESLAEHRSYIQHRFQTSVAVHCMRKGRATSLHPLATSDFNEGNTAENAKVLDDLLINQLALSKEEVEKMLVVVGGNQSTVEKLRTLKKFLASCPHGYSRYGWVLPLIQLWHMGWADLERVLSTHWGVSQGNDLSSFSSVNNILGRKVKDVKRPDYYPALHLVVDTLRVDVLDCWRDSMLHYEFQCAIADGDIGCAMNVMASVELTHGDGLNKYSNELLELTCNFEFEYSSALQTLIKNNWLCNLSGIDGYLEDKGGSHRRNKKEAAAKELRRNMAEHGVNTFRSGRTTRYIAQDDFLGGYNWLSANNEKKIKDFINRTLRDAGNIHADEDVASDVSVPTASAADTSAAPMPSMLIGGELVDGEELFQSWDGDESDSEDEGNLYMQNPVATTKRTVIISDKTIE
ncbi:hypothetical protein BV25DRAFT_1836202 [Artomyces pyxidatus]|uniref:Uncharacterized protein n=1 Tax=Artomyces pyxidatus TaxID=48021 RepID=A0ACB8TA11_9AGAM|nr:hypothetical protein BV25DRAFT_1836202 [Artomyces pyxidatus]